MKRDTLRDPVKRGPEPRPREVDIPSDVVRNLKLDLPGASDATIVAEYVRLAEDCKNHPFDCKCAVCR